MRRSALTRRTPLKPSGHSLRRARLRPLSDKTIDGRDARRAAVAEALRRDGGVCQAPPYLERCAHPDLVLSEGAWRWRGRRVPACGGRLVGHEPAHRRNVDVADPAEILSLCVTHNAWLEDEPDLGYATGLLVRGNGRRLRGNPPNQQG